MSSIRRLDSVRKLEQMKRESSGPLSFGQKLCACCLGGGTFGLLCIFLLLLLALCGLTIAKIVMVSPPNPVTMSSIRRLDSVRKLEQMKRESSGPLSFGQKLCACCLGGGTFGLLCIFLLLLLALCGLTIAKIVMGSIYLHDCPAQPLVPIYLIVGGVVSLVFNCSCRPSRGDEGQVQMSCQGCGAVVGAITGIFSLVWLITGTVFVIQTRQAIASCDTIMTTSSFITTPEVTTVAAQTAASSPQLPDINSTAAIPPINQLEGCPFCDERLLNFAFGLVITEWSFFALLLLITCCVCCLPICLAACGPTPDV